MKTIIDVLINCDGLHQISHQSFRNNYGYPWIDISSHQTTNGNFSTVSEPFVDANLIAVISLKNIHEAYYNHLLGTIANQLGWKLYAEDGEGDEDVEIKTLLNGNEI